MSERGIFGGAPGKQDAFDKADGAFDGWFYGHVTCPVRACSRVLNLCKLFLHSRATEVSAFIAAPAVYPVDWKIWSFGRLRKRTAHREHVFGGFAGAFKFERYAEVMAVSAATVLDTVKSGYEPIELLISGWE
jgi:hypothetical protein